MASELCSMSAVASCEAFFGRRGLIGNLRSTKVRAKGTGQAQLSARHAHHLADGRRAFQYLLDARLAQGVHTCLTPRVEQSGAVGLFRDQAADRVGHRQNLEDAVAAAVARLTAMQAAT